MLEQFLDMLPVELRIWFCERKPKDVAEASSMADDYRVAHRRKRFEGKTDSRKDQPSKGAVDPKPDVLEKDPRKSPPSKDSNQERRSGSETWQSGDVLTAMRKATGPENVLVPCTVEFWTHRKRGVGMWRGWGWWGVAHKGVQVGVVQVLGLLVMVMVVVFRANDFLFQKNIFRYQFRFKRSFTAKSILKKCLQKTSTKSTKN